MLTFTATCLYILLNFGGSREEPVKLAFAALNALVALKQTSVETQGQALEIYSF